MRTTHASLALATLFGLGLAVLAPRALRADDPNAAGPRYPSSVVDLQNTVCPVTGKPVTAGVTETVDGAVVHFCSAHCAAAYRKAPTSFYAALRNDPAVAKRMQQVSSMRTTAAEASTPSSPRSAALHDGMRKLWEDHVWWTRLFLVSATSDLPDREATTNRLLKNQVDLGDGIKPYYGDAAGTKLTALLKEHITTAAEIVDALKAGDASKAEPAQKRWFDNADAIAAFLSAANPSAWPADATKAMMREHLELTTAEVKARLDKDWDADIAAYEKVREQALHMADMLSDGIARQFPDKVK